MEKHDSIINQLVPLLAEDTFSALANAHCDSPIVRLKLYYYDTHAPSCYLLGYALTETCRSSIMETDGPEALRNLWCDDKSVEVELGLSGERRMLQLLADLYDLMCESESLSRELATRLSIHLNSIKWPETVSTADDFVAYPTNGTDHGCDVYEDICNCVPAEKLSLWRSRGFLGEGELDWDARPNFPTISEFVSNLVKRIETLPTEQQVSAWIQVLEKVMAGTDAEMKRMGLTAETPLGYLEQRGTESAMPLLEFAARWSETIGTWEDGWSPTPGIPDQMYRIIDFARENVDGSSQAHDLIKQVLLNAQHYQYLGLSYACCAALHQLFDGYPEPIKGGYPDERPKNLAAFTSQIE